MIQQSILAISLLLSFQAQAIFQKTMVRLNTQQALLGYARAFLERRGYNINKLDWDRGELEAAKTRQRFTDSYVNSIVTFSVNLKQMDSRSKLISDFKVVRTDSFFQSRNEPMVFRTDPITLRLVDEYSMARRANRDQLFEVLRQVDEHKFWFER